MSNIPRGAATLITICLLSLVGMAFLPGTAPVLAQGTTPAVTGPAQAPAPTGDTAPPADNSGYMKLVGAYPLSGEPLAARVVLYFTEPVTMPKGPDGAEKAPVRIEPWEVTTRYSYKNNCIVLEFPNESLQTQAAFASITVDPALRGVSGAALAPSTAPILLPSVGTPDRLFLNAASYESNTITCEIAGPISAALRERYYTRSVTNAKGEPVEASVDSLGSGSLKLTLRTSAIASLPLSLSYTRNDVPAGELESLLPKSISSLLPYWHPNTLDHADWTRTTKAKTRLQLAFANAVPYRALESALKITRESDGQPVTFSMSELSGESSLPVVLVDTPSIGDAASLVVEVAPPLIGPKGYFLAETQRKTVQASAPQAAVARQSESHTLVVYQHGWEKRGVEGACYRLSLNADMDPEAIKQALKVDPTPENLSVEAHGYGVLIKADWRSKQQYQISLAPGLKSRGGEVELNGGFAATTEPAPKVAFVRLNLDRKRFYIPKKKMGPLPIEARNVTKAQISVSRLFPSNIAAAVYDMTHRPESYYYYGEGDGDGDGEGYGGQRQDRTATQINAERYSEPIGSCSIAFPDVPDTVQSGAAKIEELFPADKRGVFTLACSNGGSSLVLWTDLGVLAHWHGSELVVFAHNLNTLAPAVSAKTTVYSDKLQVMASSNTDASGVVRFEGLERERYGAPLLVVVETPDDSTFLSLEKRQEDQLPFKENMPVFDAEGYDAYLYADRNLYRPGETAHVRWIVRTNYTDAAANVPLLFQVQTPKGRLLQSTPITTSDFGTGGLDVKTEKSFLTGKYTVELRTPGSSAPLGSATFNLEEFVPNRMKASVTADKALWKPDEAVSIAVKAENLYGGAASNRLAEAVVVLKPGVFKSTKWPAFNFTNDTVLEPVIEKLGQQQTDDGGNAGFSFTYTAKDKVTTPLQAGVYGLVFELGGREVRAKTEAIVFPAPIALGMAVSPVEGETSAELSVAAITSDEAPAALASVKVAVELEEWSYNIRRYGNDNEPYYIRSFKLVEDRDVPLQNGMGATRFHFDSSWGRYRLRVHAPETPLYSSTIINSRWNKIESESVMSKPDLIELSLNKDAYNVGDTCELHVRSPYDGTAFIAVQGESIKQTFVQPVKDGEGMVSFMLTDEHFPNIWAEVTVVRAGDSTKGRAYPYSSFSIINIPAHDGRKRISVSYPDLPKEVRPAQKLDLALETRDNAGNPIAAEVTLAAVDEGIHSILDYANPDPFTWLQRSRQADVNRAHYYDKIYYDFTPSSIGGDNIAKRLGNAPQIGDNWIKPVALWSGAVTTDANGRATVSFDVPEFNGQLRLVAVAVNKTATGAAAASLYVRRPYILQTSMPRFSLLGDQFGCGAGIINTTQDARTAVVRWKTEGTLAGQGEKKVDLAPGGEAYVQAEFNATVTGQGRILWEADVINPADVAVIEHLTQDSPLPVRAPAAWSTEHKLTVVNPGESKSFQNTTFIEDDSVEVRLTATANPLYRLQRNLSFLLHYPYGCVEQTTSSSMPLYLIEKSPQILLGLKVIPENLDPAKMVQTYIQSGVSRLFSMQTTSGGLAFWPGGTEPYPYGSVYAAHFLTLVFKDNAASVPEKAFRSLQEYLRRIMKGEETYSTRYSYCSDMYTRAYACYVLSLDGQLDAIQYIPRFDTISVPESGRWLLAAALAMNTADPERVQKYLKTAPTQAFNTWEYSGTLNSEIKNAAVRLIAATHMHLPADQVQPIMKQLTDWINDHEYYRMTTHDAAYVFSALGQYLQTVKGTEGQAAAIISGPGESKNISGLEVCQQSAKGAAKVFQVQNTGAVPVVVNFISEGVPAQPRTAPISENGLAVARAFTDDKGNPVALTGPFAHGGMYLVDLEISLRDARENVVVSDLLPAGFEVANPRLDANTVTMMGKGQAQSSENAANQQNREGNQQGTDGQNGNAEQSEDQKQKNAGVTPSFLEVRDDRLVLAFDKLDAGEHHFYYAVRAVSPGTFRQPAAVSECMYDPTVRAATVDTTVKVE